MRSEMERKLEGVFSAAGEATPEAAGAGPAARYENSLDVSPEATAERIVAFALGFFQIYRAQNPGHRDDEILSGFEAEIRRGIEDGFREARTVMAGLQLPEDDSSTSVDDTYDLVQEKLDGRCSRRAIN